MNKYTRRRFVLLGGVVIVLWLVLSPFFKEEEAISIQNLEKKITVVDEVRFSLTPSIKGEDLRVLMQVESTEKPDMIALDYTQVVLLEWGEDKTNVPVLWDIKEEGLHSVLGELQFTGLDSEVPSFSITIFDAEDIMFEWSL